MKIKKDWKFYTGITFLILSCLLPLVGLILPFLGFPVAESAFLVGVFTVGGPEVMIMLAAAFIGKEGLLYFKSKIKKFFKRKKTVKPVSKQRYYFGLFLLLASGVPLYLNAYFPEILPKDEEDKILILILSDFIFVISFFILGADFWEKFKSLFKWNVKINGVNK